jgi:acyl-CoA synthetase (AMP-forming)/AMP-acid ligase II
MNAPRTLLDAAVLTGDPGAPALYFVASDQPTVTVTRGAFAALTARYAAALRALGIGERDLVVIAHTQSLEAIAAFWACLRLGAIPSMFPTLTEKLDPAIYMRSIAELVALSGVRAVFTTDDFAPALRPHLTCPVHAAADLTLEAAPPPPPHTPDPEVIAFLQHSSGTTGLQKGVALSHRAVLNQIASYSRALALTADDVIVSWLPLYHDMGLIAGFILPLLTGIPLVIMSPFDWVAHPALLLRAIDQHRGTLCWLPNFAYNHMARRIRPRDSAGLDLSSMRMFINCSEPVFAESHALFLERFAANGVRREMLAVSYAMAENTFAVTQTPPGVIPAEDVIDRALLEGEGRAIPTDRDNPRAVIKVSCGPPIAGTECRAIGPDGQPLPDRIVGELVVRSNCMLTEYYRRPDLQPFIDGWYRTGDRGYLVDGEVYVIGRSKDLIINAGKNIYPQDIEAIVNTVAGVYPGRAVCFGVADAREGTELIAVVAETTLTDEAARRDLSVRIREAVARASTVSVTWVQIVDPGWLIKTSSGKIARAANRDKWLAERGG